MNAKTVATKSITKQAKTEGSPIAETKKLLAPLSPYLVLVAAIALPGVGQVLNNSTRRGLLMLLFMIVLGYMTHQVASPNVSMIGQYAGGLFVYAISVMDAYYWAKYRTEAFRHSNQTKLI